VAPSNSSSCFDRSCDDPIEASWPPGCPAAVGSLDGSNDEGAPACHGPLATPASGPTSPWIVRHADSRNFTKDEGTLDHDGSVSCPRAIFGVFSRSSSSILSLARRQRQSLSAWLPRVCRRNSVHGAILFGMMGATVLLRPARKRNHANCSRIVGLLFAGGVSPPLGVPGKMWRGSFRWSGNEELEARRGADPGFDIKRRRGRLPGVPPVRPWAQGRPVQIVVADPLDCRLTMFFRPFAGGGREESIRSFLFFGLSLCSVCHDGHRGDLHCPPCPAENTAGIAYIGLWPVIPLTSPLGMVLSRARLELRPIVKPRLLAFNERGLEAARRRPLPAGRQVRLRNRLERSRDGPEKPLPASWLQTWFCERKLSLLFLLEITQNSGRRLNLSLAGISLPVGAGGNSFRSRCGHAVLVLRANHPRTTTGTGIWIAGGLLGPFGVRGPASAHDRTTVIWSVKGLFGVGPCRG